MDNKVKVKIIRTVSCTKNVGIKTMMILLFGLCTLLGYVNVMIVDVDNHDNSP